MKTTTTTMISKVSLPDVQSGAGCVVAGGGDNAAVPGGETPRAAAGPCSADEMGYGLTVLWLAGMLFFLGVAVLYHGRGFEGYGLLVFSVLGFLRAAKHVAASQALAKAEDAARERQWQRWADEVGGQRSEVGGQRSEVSEEDLEDENPLWCVNEQIKDLLIGWGANEDHESVIAFFRSQGLPEGTVARIHRAIVNAENPQMRNAEEGGVR